ncbi:MAG TPA: DUF3570 domain-containing protein [Gammaproteobacteria bacterium]|nr:DUF3570 domain-containing protein [Gammaproteobacteria bacterium]
MAAAATESSRALFALTTAALALPGMRAAAALPASEPSATAQFGYYQESDSRMRVEVWHGDLVLPYHDRFELSVSFDRDTYSGATPAYSLPTAMTNRPKYAQNDDGSPASALSLADVVTAASQGVTAGELTILGGLNAYKEFVDARAAAEAAFLAANPRPLSPPVPPTLPGPVSLDFQGMALGSYAGAANATPVAGGACPGLGALGCYGEDGMVIGIVADATNPIAHLHRVGPAANRALGYHADSSGIYVRALDGAAFNLDSLLLHAPISGANPDAGADDVWEILGFDTAADPTLGAGNGVDYATRVARLSIANGYDGTLNLPAAFDNIRAFWIHYRGYPQTPADGKDFELRLDDVALSGVQATPGDTPAQLAWAAALERSVAIAQFQAVLDRAVPSGDRPVQRFQTQPRESRTQPSLNARWFFDDTTLRVGGGVSDEPDFESSFGSFDVTREFNERLTSITLGYGYTRNRISRSGVDHAGHAQAHGEEHNATDYPALDAHSEYHTVTASLGQVLAKDRLLQVSGSYTHQSGYLSNPYKFVYVRGEITAEEYYALWQAGAGEVDWASVTPLEVAGIELFRERRPDRRRQLALSTRLNQHLDALDASLQLDYRWYRDDWDIDAHTFTVEWYQSLPRDVELTPYLRYYTQSRAEFFAPYFLAPRADHTYSSDYRLSGFGALSGGLRLAKTFGAGLKLEAGIEYYTHQGDLKLGGGGAGDYADFDNYLAHASLNVDLGAAGGGHAHHAAHHAQAPLPAGVMAAHGLPKDGVMLAYRYMDMRQDGAFRLGSAALADAAVAAHCGRSACRARPSSMTMRMHMLEVMVAPTERLTLMLMPQTIDGEMEMRAIPGAAAAAHAGDHESDGLGDTQFGALLRVYQHGTQQVQAGLLLSAPTGEYAATLDDSADTPPQDYGMQRGSGTWDLRPSLTWLGAQGRWFYGAQLGAVFRLEDANDAGYALGDGWQASGWGGVQFLPWLAGTLRIAHAVQDAVRGELAREEPIESPAELPFNQGGRYTDLGIGAVATVTGGAFAGHRFSAEWLQPIADDPNGAQLERDGALMASWSFAF